jgi:hypothetical protein
VAAPAPVPFKFNPEASDFTPTRGSTASTGAHCVPFVYETEEHRTRNLKLSRGFFGQVRGQVFLHCPPYDNGHLHSSRAHSLSLEPGAFYAFGNGRYHAPHYYYNGQNCASSDGVSTWCSSFAPQMVADRIYTTQTELRALLYMRIRLQRLCENSAIDLSDRDQGNILRHAMERLTGKLEHHKWDGDYNPSEIAAVLGAVHNNYITGKKASAARKRYFRSCSCGRNYRN